MLKRWITAVTLTFLGLAATYGLGYALGRLIGGA